MKNTIPPLKKGDLIYITAPAKAIEKEYVLYSKAFFEKHGFRVLLSEHCLGTNNYFSGTDDERLADLQFGIDNPEIKAIVCARGGYGCIRIVDRIQWASMLREPKWLVGYSDITIFHQRLQRFELQSIHGTMPFNFEKNSPEALETLLAAMKGEEYSITCSGHKLNQLGTVKGKLVGGNLSILYSLLGTDDQIDYSNTILFIEDLSEHLYHIDRMLFAFEKAGVFNKIKGLIVGGMTDLKDTDTPFGETIEEIILHHFKYRKIPIAFNFPAGHIDDNRALKLGSFSELIVDDLKTTLNFR